MQSKTFIHSSVPCCGISKFHTTVPTQPPVKNINNPMNTGENFQIHVVLFWSILKHDKWWVNIASVLWAPHMCLYLPYCSLNAIYLHKGTDWRWFFLVCDPLQGTDSPKKCWWDTGHLTHFHPKWRQKVEQGCSKWIYSLISIQNHAKQVLQVLLEQRISID